MRWGLLATATAIASLPGCSRGSGDEAAPEAQPARIEPAGPAAGGADEACRCGSAARVMEASVEHAGRIRERLEKVHRPAWMHFDEAVREQKTRIATAVAGREPVTLLRTVQDDARDLETLEETELARAFDLREAGMLVGQLSAFANDTVGPVLQAIALWNRLDEQIRLHVQATNRSVSRYAFQLGLLSAAGFEKADRCRGYVERHGTQPSPDARVRRTLEACRALLADLAEGGADLSSLVDAAIAAYEAGLAMDQESLADRNAALEALREKVRSRSADGVARYLGAARFAVVFDRDFRPGATDRRPLAGALGAGIRLVELTLGGADPVQLLEEPVSWAELGITDDVGQARNLLVVTVDVPPDERGTTRYFFAPGPAARNAWNDMNGDGAFDADDIELFWRSLAAKPQLWALPVDPSPALASIGAFDSMVFAEYQARLGEIADTLAALDAALLDATRRLAQIR